MGKTVSLTLQGDVLTVQPYRGERGRDPGAGRAFVLEVADEATSNTLLASLPLLDRLLAEKGQPGRAYLICSGHSVSVQTLLDTLIELNGVDVEVRPDERRMNPSDIPCLYGSYARIERDTGWRPMIPLRQSLRDALDDWQQRLAQA